MSNYNQYYYNGDTINARVVEDGFAVDLRSLVTRAKMYDPEYRSGVGKMLNSIYERKFGHESKRFKTRTVPELSFVADESLQYGAKIEAILQEIKNDAPESFEEESHEQ